MRVLAGLVGIDFIRSSKVYSNPAFTTYLLPKIKIKDIVVVHFPNITRKKNEAILTRNSTLLC